eukprot:COSAG06_NODE_12101_length_1424_cov_1.175094_3_plen_45_part_01
MQSWRTGAQRGCKRRRPHDRAGHQPKCTEADFNQIRKLSKSHNVF